MCGAVLRQKLEYASISALFSSHVLAVIGHRSVQLLKHSYAWQCSMSVPSNSRNPHHQAARVPKLAYRNAIPQDEADKIRSQARETAVNESNASRTGSSHSSNARPGTQTELSVPAKKKNSFLSGLFAKEPTIMALAQVEADLVAKHGAATPQAVPHVSARKLPDHVPKVNSKWDGVPEVVKQREREQKQKSQLSQKTSLAPDQSIRSHSTDSSARTSARGQRTRRRRESDTASGTETWQTPEGTSNRYYAPSVYSASSEDSQQARGRQVASSVRSQSLRSPSGTSLPEITSFFPHHDKNPVPAVPQRWQSVNSTTASSMGSSDQSRSDYSQRETDSSTIGVIPEHSSSPITTPREMSPVTPSYASDRAAFPIQTMSETESSRRSQVTRSQRVLPGQIDAFLAGEASPLDINDKRGAAEQDSDLPLRRFQQVLVDRVEPDIAKRPDSSRARLGLRASMVVRSEAAPWESEDPSMPAPDLRGPTSQRRLPKALALFR